MNLEQITNSINTIKGFDISILYNDPNLISKWNINLTSEHVKLFTEDTIAIMSSLQDNIDILNKVAPPFTSTIQSSLINFVNTFNNFKQNLERSNSNIGSYYVNCMTQLESFNSTIRQAWLYQELKNKETTGLKNALLDNKEKIEEIKNKLPDMEKAIYMANQLLDKKSKINENAAEEYWEIFAEKSTKHWKKIIWRIWGMVVSGVFILWLLWYFLFWEKDSSFWTHTVLRMSALSVLIYFLIFCVNQYLYQKKMQNSYEFKDVSSKIMINLKQTASNEQEKDKILDKWLSILFDDVNNKHEKDSVSDKQLVSQMIAMLQNQMNSK